MPRHRLLHRDLHSAEHLDLFLVAAVSSVLLIRFYLRLANYPQVGGASLHVAHMLWGGLLMLAALVLLLGYLGRRSRLWAALVGGVGFGTFIDEIGKFVTHDNDYFYRPAIALIYVVFVLLYLAARSLRRRATVTREEYLVNALHEFEQAVVNDLQPEERERALGYLAAIRERDALTGGLERLLRDVGTAPASRPGLLLRMRRGALGRYRRLVAHPGFGRALVAIFLAQIVVKLAAVAVLVVWPDGSGSVAASVALLGDRMEGLTLDGWIQLASSLASAALVALGIASLRRSRALALRCFHRSLLVSIFLTQVFMFYRAQWAALAVLAFNLLLLAGVDYMREREREAEGRAAGRVGGAAH